MITDVKRINAKCNVFLNDSYTFIDIHKNVCAIQGLISVHRYERVSMAAKCKLYVTIQDHPRCFDTGPYVLDIAIFVQILAHLWENQLRSHGPISGSAVAELVGITPVYICVCVF